MSRPAAFLVLLAAAACASAQVTLSTVEGGVVTPVGQVYDFGSVALGSAADVDFRLTNTGSSPVYVTYLNVYGGTQAFSVACALSPDLCGGAPLQKLPIQIEPAGTLDFTVQFEPLQLGSPSATMNITAGNIIPTVFLTGTGVPAPPALTLLQGTQPLAAGQTISFGNVQVGSRSPPVELTLANQSDAPLPIPAITLTGGSFSASGSALSATSVPAGSSAELDVMFAPTAPGLQQATLTVGPNTYPLQGTGLAVFPVPSIQVTSATLASAQQGTLSVSLASASPAAGDGTVTLAYAGNVSGCPTATGNGNDPAIAFANGTLSATFNVAQGESTGQFSGEPSVSFGTGTTAGALCFNVTLGSNTNSVQASVTIPPALIGVDAAVAVRNVACDPALVYCTTTNVQLQINGWDNTRSASQLVFTFFNSAGAQISPSPIAVTEAYSNGIELPIATAFQQYFATSAMAGVFGVTAFFPVTGSSDDVVAAVVQLTNSVGTVESATITF